MRPKEYYDQFTIQEDARYIFTLMPSEFEKQYKKFIKESIESIELESGELLCESYSDTEAGADKVDEVWKNIQKAGIIIANITGFKPKVMLELGVAMMKKARVILVAEKSLEGKQDLPINIGALKVKFYEPDKMTEFSNWVKNQVLNWISPEEPKIKNSEVNRLMNDALELRRNENYSTAYLLFENMDKKDPGNWYIYKEWGITYKEDKNLAEARKRLEQALEFAQRTRYKSEIYTELGVVFRESNMMDNALVAFEKAENLNRDNADLYDKWAYSLYTIGKYSEALDKMKIAFHLDSNNEIYKGKFDYYSKKFLNPGLPIRLEDWIRDLEQTPEQTGEKPINNGRNTKINFDKFTKKYRIGEIIEGKIENTKANLGAFVRLTKEINGMIFWKRLPGNFDLNPRYAIGKSIRVKIIRYKHDQSHVQLEEVR
jgi:tetratricopeptide (TPR) repeat protein